MTQLPVEIKFTRHTKMVSHVDELTGEEKDELLTKYAMIAAAFNAPQVKPTTNPYEIMDKIIALVSEHKSMSLELFQSITRQREIAFARHLCFYLIKQKTVLPLKTIGKTFKRDHTTIIHGIKTIGNLMTYDAEIRREVHYFLNLC